MYPGRADMLCPSVIDRFGAVFGMFEFPWPAERGTAGPCLAVNGFSAGALQGN
jgi:hypothetical protein